MQNESRRNFLKTSVAAASATAAVGALSSSAGAQSGGSSRRVVAGSPSPNYSRAVEFNRVVYVAGVLGIKPGARELISPDFEPQARQALENIKANVEASGSKMENVLKCTCFLTEEKDFTAFNKVYIEFFPKDPPARSTVIVKALVVPGAKVEVDCVTCIV